MATPSVMTAADISAAGGATAAQLADIVAGGSRRVAHVGSRTIIPDTSNTASSQNASRRWDVAKDDIAALALVYGNWILTAAGEQAITNPRTVRADIEYPIGTFTRVTWNSGATTTGSLTAGQDELVSDFMSVTIPKGAIYRISTWTDCIDAAYKFNTDAQGWQALGDGASSGIADPTGAPWTPASVGGIGYNPYAIIAQTRIPSIMGVGDSRVAGTGLGSGSGFTPFAGCLAALASTPGIGFLNMARGSQSAQSAASGQFAKRAAYFKYVSAAVLGLGYNDLNIGGRTALQVYTDRQTIRGLAPNLKWFQTTIEPATTSTDSWATIANQSPNGLNATRIVFNDNYVRAGAPGFSGYLDLADAVETQRNSGLIKAPPMVPNAITTDGLHFGLGSFGLYRPYVANVPELYRR